MSIKKSRKFAAIALLAFLAQHQAALSATTAAGNKVVKPVLDHNSNRALYGNKPIVTPRVNVTPSRGNAGLQGERENSDAQHLTFVGKASEPVAIEKGNGGKEGGEAGKNAEGAKNKDESSSQALSDKNKDNDEQKAVGKEKGSKPTSTQLAEDKQQLTNVIEQNWASWTSKTNGQLSLPLISSLLYSGDLSTPQINALSAIAARVEHMMALAYNNHQSLTGRVYLTEGKDGGIQVHDGISSNTEHLGMTGVAESFAAKMDEREGCNFAFKASLLQYWNTWTASTSGVMTFKLFNQLCKQTKPPITGNEAAALAALGNQMNNMQVSDKKGPLVTLKLQVSSGGGVSILNGSGGSVSTGPVAFSDYACGVRMLAADVKQPGTTGHQKQDHLSLYGPSGAIVINDVRQDWYNDCFFLSSVWGCMHSFGTSYVQNMIKQIGPDRFAVTFPGYASPIDIRITPTEAAMFSKSTNGGCYLAVLAMAADKVYLTEHPKSGRDSRLTPLYEIVNDGWDRPFLQLMTGNHYISRNTPTATDTDLHGFESALEKAMKDNVPVSIATKDHYMTISGYYPNRSSEGLPNYQGPAGATGPFVQIHNQWGNTGDYTIAGSNYVVHMENGYFTLPVADLNKCGLISIQLPTRAEESVMIAGHSASPKPNPAPIDDFKVTASNGSHGGTFERRISPTPQPSPSRGTAAQGAAFVPTPNSAHRIRNGKQSGCSPSNVNPMSGGDEENENRQVKQIEMVNGTILIAHTKPVEVNVPGAKVQITPGAAVYISRQGNAAAVFNLTNTTHGDVKLAVGDSERSVPVGQAIVVCSDAAADFKDINPCRAILDPKRVKILQSSPGVKVFSATFSPVAVLDDSAQFLQLVRSSDPAERALAERILKTAAGLSQLMPSQ